MAHYLDALAEFVAGTDSAQLPPSAVRAAKDVFLDTIGAMAAGSALPENASLARQVAHGPGSPGATLIGHGLTADPLLAALVNATAGVALEVDEGNRYGGGHPAIHVLPGLLAVAEESAATGAEVLAALVAGYEVTSRLGGATRPRHNVHSHGHWGAPGTAAAVARLKGLDAGAVRSVISMAASMSPANTWTPCFEGATVRNLYPGRSSLQGILATHLHACGFTALEDGPCRRLRRHPRRRLRFRRRGGGPGRRLPHRAELLQVPRLLPLQPPHPRRRPRPPRAAMTSPPRRSTACA